MRLFAYPTPNQVIAFMLGVTTMTLLWAGTAYTSPPARCVGEQGTAWLGSPIARCYRLTDLFPASALEKAR